MSIRVMSWVWDHGPDDRNEMLVLLALADHADDAGRCYPSMIAIARKARMTERGAQKIVRRLEQIGAIETTIGNGRGGCNVYRIITKNPERHSVNTDANPEHGSPPNTVHPEQVNTKPRTGERETPNGGSPEPSITIIEPSESISRKSVSGENPEFEAFWSAYPRKIAKGAARKAWCNAIKTADPQTIIAAARRVEDRGEFTPHPGTWLNAERWLDGVAPISQRLDDATIQANRARLAALEAKRRTG